jgi:hypothetical protein
VTLLLMATAAGFVISYERLTDAQGFSQPSLDRERYVSARNKLETILTEGIGESDLIKNQESWRGGKLVSAVGLPDNWPEVRDPTKFDANVPVSHVVLGLRHALAHGNVLTRSDPNGEISQLVFVSGGDRGIPLRYVLVSPSDLAKFLEAWFGMVQDLPLPYQEVLRIVGQAA